MSPTLHTHPMSGSSSERPLRLSPRRVRTSSLLCCLDVHPSTPVPDPQTSPPSYSLEHGIRTPREMRDRKRVKAGGKGWIRNPRTPERRTRVHDGWVYVEPNGSTGVEERVLGDSHREEPGHRCPLDKGGVSDEKTRHGPGVGVWGGGLDVTREGHVHGRRQCVLVGVTGVRQVHGYHAVPEVVLRHEATRVLLGVSTPTGTPASSHGPDPGEESGRVLWTLLEPVWGRVQTRRQMGTKDGGSQPTPTVFYGVPAPPRLSRPRPGVIPRYPLPPTGV